MTSPEDKVAQWIRPEIRALSAYHVPDAGGFIKLDAMENPYVWPEEMVDEWLERLRGVDINRYPDPAAGALRARLAEAFAVPAGMELLLGNGSDELIQILAMAVAGPGRVVLAPEPSFVMYRMIAQFVGLDYVGVPLAADDFSLDRAAMADAIERHQPALVFLAYPNNPTGNAFDAEAMREIIAMTPGLVVVDEAYAAFADDSFLPQLADFPNLLVMRTVSKMGLAGLRLGLLAGAPAWLRELDKLRLPYNINVLTQMSAQFALAHKDVLDEQTARIRHDRGLLHDALTEIPGLTVFPSQANFILFRTPSGRADPIFQGLKEHGVLIKNLNGAGGMLTDCLRVTVGTAEENAAFLKALRSLM